MPVTSIVSLNQLITWFQTYQQNNHFLKDFGFGEPYDIGTSRQMTFPYMWVTMNEDSSIATGSNVKSAIPDLSFSIMFMDKINIQENYLNTNGFPSDNSQEILSDCIQYLQDLVTDIQLNWGTYGVLISQDVSFFPAVDETTDKSTGIVARIVLRTRQVNCIIPENPYFITPTPTATTTPLPITPTPTPTTTSTITPTITPTPTLTPTDSRECRTYTIQSPCCFTNTFNWTNCDGTPGSITGLSRPATNICAKEGSVTQTGGGTITDIGTCPLPTPTPTLTPTNTPTPTQTCNVTTQYMEVELFDNTKFKLILWNDYDFTSPATALVDYVVSGTAYGSLGTIYTATETITQGQHQHQFNLSSVLQSGEVVTGFTTYEVYPASYPCPIEVLFCRLYDFIWEGVGPGYFRTCDGVLVEDVNTPNQFQPNLVCSIIVPYMDNPFALISLTPLQSCDGNQTCLSYEIDVIVLQSNVEYTDCNGDTQTITLSQGLHNLCSLTTPTALAGTIDIIKAYKGFC
jgi:hypothetical protein